MEFALSQNHLPKTVSRVYKSFIDSGLTVTQELAKNMPMESVLGDITFSTHLMIVKEPALTVRS